MIRARQGDDVLLGRAGPDLLVGGNGSDRIRAGPGDDRVEADDHRRDLVDCGAGADLALVDKRDIISESCEVVRRR